VNVYDKADKSSRIEAVTPKGLIRIKCDYYVRGLNDDDMYWYVAYRTEEVYFFGFIHDEDIDDNTIKVIL